MTERNRKEPRNHLSRKWLVVGLTLGILGWAAVDRAPAQPVAVWHYGTVTVTGIHVPNPQENVNDFVNAQPMELPRAPGPSAAETRQDLIDAITLQRNWGQARYSPGATGDGTTDPLELGVPSAPATDSSNNPTPYEYGSSNIPFSTARADLNPTATNKSYPYRASGRLTFTTPSGSKLCSASLIKPGVVVTAAHCLMLFGSGKFYSNWQFAPGYRNGSAPYGLWTVSDAFVVGDYNSGADPCTTAGIICQDDVGVLVLKAKSGTYPGTKTGWYGWATDGYGFTGGLTQITQIGYPNGLDNSLYMERNDSAGTTSSSNSNNTLIGTLMGPGSSGGPWVINFGKQPTLTGATAGTDPQPNAVVGVTSWGSTSPTPLMAGASPFLSTNISSLVTHACTIAPGAC